MKTYRRLLLTFILSVPILSGCNGDDAATNITETATFDTATFDNATWE